jgi:hypothetical protein
MFPKELHLLLLLAREGQEKDRCEAAAVVVVFRLSVIFRVLAVRIEELIEVVLILSSIEALKRLPSHAREEEVSNQSCVGHKQEKKSEGDPIPNSI